MPYSELIIFNTLGFPTQDKQVCVGCVCVWGGGVWVFGVC